MYKQISAETSVSHTRNIPEQWSILVQTAQQELEKGVGLEAATRQTAELGNTFDNEQVEACRYYGLGLVICNLAQELRE